MSSMLDAIYEAHDSLAKDLATEHRRQWWEAQNGRPALVAIVHPDQEGALREALVAAGLDRRLEIRASRMAPPPGTVYVIDQSAVASPILYGA